MQKDSVGAVAGRLMYCSACWYVWLKSVLLLRSSLVFCYGSKCCDEQKVDSLSVSVADFNDIKHLLP